jgi:hypothetical protein
VKKITRERLQEIADGAHTVKREEAKGMARELLGLRAEEEDRDGTMLVTLQHASDKAMSGWFADQQRRVPIAECHVGGRICIGGRYYHVVALPEPGVVRVK